MKKEVTFKNIIFFLFHNIQSATQITPKSFLTEISKLESFEFKRQNLSKNQNGAITKVTITKPGNKSSSPWMSVFEEMRKHVVTGHMVRFKIKRVEQILKIQTRLSVTVEAVARYSANFLVKCIVR